MMTVTVTKLIDRQIIDTALHGAIYPQQAQTPYALIQERFDRTSTGV